MTGSFSSGASGSGAVDSVNGQTGVVTITANGLDAGVARGSDTNNSGNTTITPTNGVAHHLHALTIGGAARTSVVILATANRNAGDEIEILGILPDTADIVLEFRDATSGGTLLKGHTTDGTEATFGLRLGLRFRYSGSAWEWMPDTYASP